MRKKPKGDRYRNLYRRGSLIFYGRVFPERRVRVSTKTSDWETAAEWRERYERDRERRNGAGVEVEAPRFNEVADKYLKLIDVEYQARTDGHLAGTTIRERRSHLRDTGPLRSYFGAYRLDSITERMVDDWWTEEVVMRRRSGKTGANHLDTMAAIFDYAHEKKLIGSAHDPVAAFRAAKRTRRRRKSSRASSEAAHRINPILSASGLRRIDAEAQKMGLETLVLIRLLFDAGLRTGEALALSWDRVGWGVDDLDDSRHLLIDRSRPHAGELETTKSGRSRRVAMSRRLQTALREFYLARGRPPLDTGVLPRWSMSDLRRRHWDKVMSKAGVTGHSPHDSRSTAACHLLMMGVPFEYLVAFLGHAGTGEVTRNHYAVWVGTGYQRGPELAPGEVVPDLLAKVTHEPASAEGRLHSAV
jgi:integrase